MVSTTESVPLFSSPEEDPKLTTEFGAIDGVTSGSFMVPDEVRNELIQLNTSNKIRKDRGIEFALVPEEVKEQAQLIKVVKMY